MRFAAAFAATIALTAACSCRARREERRQAPQESIAEVERTYGPLVATGNYPTPDQNGTGGRVGLFQDASGAIWGLPLFVDGNAVVAACAPAAVRDAKATDSFDAESSVVGATNQPTGWRGGTGDLELLLRDGQGTIRRQAVHGADLDEAACRAPELASSRQRLHYYHLVPYSGNR